MAKKFKIFGPWILGVCIGTHSQALCISEKFNLEILDASMNELLQSTVNPQCPETSLNEPLVKS